MKKLIVWFTLIFSIMLPFSGCAEQQSSERIARINYSPVSFNFFTQAIIQELGLLEKYMPKDVTVEWHNITSGSEMRDALVAGQIDLTGLAAPSVVVALQNDFPIMYVCYLGTNWIKMYSSNSDIMSMEDLTSNHKISVPSIGTVPHTAFLIAAVNDLGSADRFEDSMIIMSNEDAANALISETVGVDAVVTSLPLLLAAEQAENVHLVRDFSDEVDEYGIGTFLCTRTEFAEKNPDILDAYLEAHDEAVRLITEDRDACVEIAMNAIEGCDEETANEVLDFFIQAQDYNGEKYDRYINFMHEHGLIEEQAAPFAEIPKYARGD